MKAYKLTKSYNGLTISTNVIGHYAAIMDQYLLSLENTMAPRSSLKIEALSNEKFNEGTPNAIEEFFNTPIEVVEEFETIVSEKIIRFPKKVSGVTSIEDHIVVNVVEDFSSHTRETINKERKLIKWVLDTFPTAKYYKSRAKFVLPEKYEGNYITKYIIRERCVRVRTTCKERIHIEVY